MKVLALILAVTLGIGCGMAALSQAPEALPLDKALRKARADGKYRMLLAQIRMPEDVQQFSSFHDFGYRTETTCGEYTNLPKGYWVYVYPTWYIWRDRADSERPKRPWGPEQATGKPDTPEPGDVNTAWASATPDGSDEWLMLEYETPVWAKAAHIYETYNPGSVLRITAFTLDGREVEIWRRARPNVFQPTKQPAVESPTVDLSSGGDVFLGGLPLLDTRDAPFRVRLSPPQVAAPFGRVYRPAFATRVFTNRIKIYLASKAVPGWNEIDAVGLRGEDGSLQWAIAAHASSTYGAGTLEEPREDPRDQRIRLLEEETRRLMQELDSLKRRLSKGGE